jgi:hypothetical protein
MIAAPDRRVQGTGLWTKSSGRETRDAFYSGKLKLSTGDPAKNPEKLHLSTGCAAGIFVVFTQRRLRGG